MSLYNDSPLRGGQGRKESDLLAMWPGLFRITLFCLIVSCAVLAVHTINNCNESLEALAQARAHAIHQQVN